MTKRHKRSKRGLHYRALAEGYRILKPQVAEIYENAADHYDESDPPIETKEGGEGEREGTVTVRVKAAQ